MPETTYSPEHVKRVEDALRSAPGDNAVKAQAWDAYADSNTPEDFKSKFDGLGIDRSVKAALFNLKFNSDNAVASPASSEPPTPLAMPIVPKMPLRVPKGIVQEVPTISGQVKKLLSADAQAQMAIDQGQPVSNEMVSQLGQAASEPLIPLDSYVNNKKGFVGGVAKKVGELTSPVALGTIGAGIAATAATAGTAAAPILHGLFAAGIAKGLWESGDKIADAFEAGDYEQVAHQLGYSSVDILMAAALGRSAYKKGSAAYDEIQSNRNTRALREAARGTGPSLDDSGLTPTGPTEPPVPGAPPDGMVPAGPRGRMVTPDTGDVYRLDPDGQWRWYKEPATPAEPAAAAPPVETAPAPAAGGPGGGGGAPIEPAPPEAAGSSYTTESVPDGTGRVVQVKTLSQPSEIPQTEPPVPKSLLDQIVAEQQAKGGRSASEPRSVPAGSSADVPPGSALDAAIDATSTEPPMPRKTPATISPADAALVFQIHSGGDQPKTQDIADVMDAYTQSPETRDFIDQTIADYKASQQQQSSENDQPAVEEPQAAAPAVEPAPAPQQAAPEVAPEPKAETAPPAEEPKAMAESEINPATKSVAVGRTGTTRTINGTKVKFRYEIIDADNVRTSFDKGFNQELQPRDTNRAASEIRIQNTAAKMDPALMADNPLASDGAPIFGPDDDDAETRNHGIEAVRTMYKSMPQKADEFRAHLAERADEFGYAPEDINKAAKPMLIRRRIDRLDPAARRDFVVAANNRSTAPPTPTEQANLDAEKLTSDIMAKFVPHEEGKIDHQDNLAFIRDFMDGVVGTNDSGSLQTGTGTISKAGIDRVRNAIFAKAYGNSGALEKMTEDPNPNIKNVVNGMLLAAPAMAVMREDIKAGVLHPLDIAQDLTDAADKFSFLKESGTKIDHYLAQLSLDGGGLSPESKAILVAFSEYSRSGKTIAAVVGNYVKGVNAAGNPLQPSMFDGPDGPPTKQELLYAAIATAEEARPSVKSTNATTGKPAADSGSEVPEEGPSGDGKKADGSDEAGPADKAGAGSEGAGAKREEPVADAKPVVEPKPAQNVKQPERKVEGKPEREGEPPRPARGRSGKAPIAEQTPEPKVKFDEDSVRSILKTLTSVRFRDEGHDESVGGNAGLDAQGNALNGVSTVCRIDSGEIVAIGNPQHIPDKIVNDPENAHLRFLQNLGGLWNGVDQGPSKILNFVGDDFRYVVGPNPLSEQAEANLIEAISRYNEQQKREYVPVNIDELKAIKPGSPKPSGPARNKFRVDTDAFKAKSEEPPAPVKTLTPAGTKELNDRNANELQKARLEAGFHAKIQSGNPQEEKGSLFTNKMVDPSAPPPGQVDMFAEPPAPKAAAKPKEAEAPAPKKAEAEFKHEFSSTQVDLPEPLAGEVRAMAARIPNDDLSEGSGDYSGGREDEPHVTVKYDLHSNSPAEAKKLLADQGPITLKLGKTSVFKNPDKGFDVVKIAVDSPDLHRLNKLIADKIDHTYTYPDYKPHVTLAYVKSGLGEKYSGMTDLEGQSITLDEVVFSGRDGKHTIIKLGGAAPANVQTRTSEPPAPKEKQPWEMTNQEYLAKERKEKYDAIVKYLASGKTVALSTVYRSSTLSSPDQIKLGKDSVQAAEGRGKFVHLTDPQLDNLAEQAGFKILSFAEREYHSDIVNQAIADGKPVPENVLADYKKSNPPDDDEAEEAPAPKSAAVEALISDARTALGGVEFIHGTTKANVDQILKSGKFKAGGDVGRQYDYSVMGPDVTYFAPKKSFWFDNPDGGRAVTYESQIPIKVSDDAQILTLRSEADVDSLAKAVGVKDGAEFLKKMNVDFIYSKEDPEYEYPTADQRKATAITRKIRALGIDAMYIPEAIEPRYVGYGKGTSFDGIADQLISLNNEKFTPLPSEPEMLAEEPPSPLEREWQRDTEAMGLKPGDHVQYEDSAAWGPSAGKKYPGTVLGTHKWFVILEMDNGNEAGRAARVNRSYAKFGEVAPLGVTPDGKGPNGRRVIMTPGFTVEKIAGVAKRENPEAPAPKSAAVPVAESKPGIKQPWQMDRDSWVEQQENAEADGAPRSDSRWKKGRQLSDRERLIEDWYDANEQAYIDGNKVSMQGRPAWSLTAAQDAARSDDPMDDAIWLGHRDLVKQAVEQGKPVPENVLLNADLIPQKNPPSRKSDKINEASNEPPVPRATGSKKAEAVATEAVAPSSGPKPAANAGEPASEGRRRGTPEAVPSPAGPKLGLGDNRGVAAERENKPGAPAEDRRPVVGRDGADGAPGRAGQESPVKKPKQQRVPKIITVGDPPTLDVSNVPRPKTFTLYPHQEQAIAASIKAMSEGDRGFLNAGGTGSGKSTNSTAVARHFLDKGKAVLLVAPAEVMKFEGTDSNMPQSSYKDWISQYGLEPIRYKPGMKNLEPGKFYIATYNAFGDAEVDDNVVLIADESHALKNVKLSQRGKTGVDLISKAHAVLLMTATPADKPEHIEYLKRVGIFEGKEEKQALQDMGMRVFYKTNKKTGEKTEEWGVDPRVGTKEVRRRFLDVFSRLIQQGKMRKEEIALDAMDIKVEEIKLPPEAEEVADLIESELSGRTDKKNIMMHMRRQQEPFKIAGTVEMVKKELAEGRKVVIFVNRVNKSDVTWTERIRNQYGEIIDEIVHLVHTSEGTAKSLKEALLATGIKNVAEIHGGAEDSSAEGMRKFQENEADVVIATAPSGGTGIDLDDKVGDKPRTIFVMTPEFDAMNNIQLMGRIYRMSTKSDARVRYLFADSPIDRWNASKLSAKIKTLSSVVQGESAKMDIGQFFPDEEEDDTPAVQSGGNGERKKKLPKLKGKKYGDYIEFFKSQADKFSDATGIKTTRAAYGGNVAGFHIDDLEKYKKQFDISYEDMKKGPMGYRIAAKREAEDRAAAMSRGEAADPFAPQKLTLTSLNRELRLFGYSEQLREGDGGLLYFVGGDTNNWGLGTPEGSVRDVREAAASLNTYDINGWIILLKGLKKKYDSDQLANFFRPRERAASPEEAPAPSSFFQRKAPVSSEPVAAPAPVRAPAPTPPQQQSQFFQRKTSAEEPAEKPAKFFKKESEPAPRSFMSGIASFMRGGRGAILPDVSEPSSEPPMPVVVVPKKTLASLAEAKLRKSNLVFLNSQETAAFKAAFNAEVNMKKNDVIMGRGVTLSADRYSLRVEPNGAGVLKRLELPGQVESQGGGGTGNAGGSSDTGVGGDSGVGAASPPVR